MLVKLSFKTCCLFARIGITAVSFIAGDSGTLKPAFDLVKKERIDLYREESLEKYVIFKGFGPQCQIDLSS